MSGRHETLEVVNGIRKSVFRRENEGWRPDWFYENDRPMLRFKDHEWLAIGHVHPAHAPEATRRDDGGLDFSGVASYGATRVTWTLSVYPDPMGAGFLVECAFQPEAPIELLEAYATFETPYDYDGKETATTVIGMNPVTRWRGAERVTPPIWENPAWVYARPQVARITGPCHAPLLVQVLEPERGEARAVTVVGDWSVCRIRDLCATPTRNTPNDPPSVFANDAETRGYKYIVGALNWSSAFAKDPNVLFEGGVVHRQRLAVDYQSGLREGELLDERILRAWDRACAFERPPDGVVEVWERVKRKGVSWQTAMEWLRGVFTGDGAPHFYLPDRGICTYVVGTRPKAGDDYSWGWWPQWSGGLHYRAQLLGDGVLEAAAEAGDRRCAAASRRRDSGLGAPGVATLPALWWLLRQSGRGPLAEPLRSAMDALCRRSCAENGRVRRMDSGVQAAYAEAMLLAHGAFGEPAFREQALVLLAEINARLDAAFWSFNCGETASLIHGGQIRSMGHGHAVMANLLAHRLLKDTRYLSAARRFGRFLVGISYATSNGSADPDFDFRGWCNGSNAGRDQIAEFPPWETTNALLCLAALMAEAELEPAFYDLLWYFARTGPAQFPAARTLKRLLGQDYGVRYVPREDVASERDFYDVLPYLAYENPHDQTLAASYQGSDCLLGELVFGGGLARAEDDRLGVIVPRAATLDPAERTERIVHAWNPLAHSIETEVVVSWPDNTTDRQRIVALPRTRASLMFSKGQGLGV